MSLDCLKKQKKRYYQRRPGYTSLENALRSSRTTKPLPLVYEKYLKDKKRTMTEMVRECNGNNPIKVIHLAPQKGNLINGDKDQRVEVERIISLADEATGKPLSIGVLRIFTKALEQYTEFAEQIKKGSIPFGEIIRGIQLKYKLRLGSSSSLQYAVRDKAAKDAIKELFSDPNSDTAKRIVNEFGLNDNGSVIYGRHNWLQLNGKNICKVIEFLRPGLE